MGGLRIRSRRTSEQPKMAETEGFETRPRRSTLLARSPARSEIRGFPRDSTPTRSEVEISIGFDLHQPWAVCGHDRTQPASRAASRLAQEHFQRDSGVLMRRKFFARLDTQLRAKDLDACALDEDRHEILEPCIIEHVAL
jgi:hypothetical protein